MHNVEFKYIQLGKPTQNTFIERFNEVIEDVLNRHIFESIDQVDL